MKWHEGKFKGVLFKARKACLWCEIRSFDSSNNRVFELEAFKFFSLIVCFYVLLVTL